MKKGLANTGVFIKDSINGFGDNIATKLFKKPV
jgi:hypothetical protein